MYNKKSLATIFLFFMASFWLIFVSITARSRQLNVDEILNEKTVEKSEFVNVHYFRSTKNKPDFELKSSELNIVDQNLLNFKEPNGIMYSKDRQINYSAKSGRMNQSKKHLTLVGDVRLKDDDSTYRSQNLIYSGERQQLEATGEVKSSIIDEKTRDKINISSDMLVSDLKAEIAIFTGNVAGEINRRKRYEGSIDFKAQVMEFNSLKSEIKLDNYVEIRRNNYHLTAGRAEIFLENFNKKLKYYTLYDDVKLEEKITLASGKRQLRRAFAEKLESRQKESKIILTGAPRVEQGSDIIKGYQITLKENVELVEVDDSKSNFSLKKDKND